MLSFGSGFYIVVCATEIYFWTTVRWNPYVQRIHEYDRFLSCRFELRNIGLGIALKL